MLGILILGSSLRVEAEPREQSRKPGVCKRVFAMTAVLGTVVGTWPVASHVTNEVRALIRAQEHMGMAIFFDKEGVEAKLTAEQRALLQNPQKNAVEIARAFYHLLDSTYDESVTRKKDWFPAAQLASDYLGDNPLHEGVCRHKACVLKGVLEQFGIEAELYSARGGGEQGHVFVYLPQEDAVFDPVAQVEGYRMADLRLHPFFTEKDIFRTSSHWFWGPFHWLEDGISR